MAQRDEFNIVLAGAQDIPAVQSLWREYWDSFGLPADFQGFEEECSMLPGVYAPPRGRLLLAFYQGEPAGTAALRVLDDSSCEAKRFYIRPQYRGKGIGGALLGRLIEEARAMGYKEVYGDTLESMSSALRMYRRLGFSEVAPYSPEPTPGAIYLKLVL